jgi:methylenetetrahydrofolate--tRNA-(uracil-5-)-methyltransferase
VPPRTTAIGALAYYVSHADPRHYQPSNITFGIMEPLTGRSRKKADRKLAYAERALAALDAWMAQDGAGALASAAGGDR